ncbi:Acyl-CoA synthetase member 2 mitochondrial [Sparganum proliferum]
MGSPISGLIAEAVLQRLESLVFQHHRPKFWARYVDDTFVVIGRDQLLTFKEHLNAVLPDIQFAMEKEDNNQLDFLDVLVCRKDCGGLKTKFFRKATNTMQVLNFNSNHPISHKRSCVRTLYRRVEMHCTEVAERNREQIAIREAAPEDKVRKLPAPTSSKNDKLVYNLSSMELTEEELQVLRHEASFNTAGAKPSNMVAVVESILNRTKATDETKNLIRHQVSSFLMAHMPRNVLYQVESDALMELRVDNDLDIVPADKTRSTVVLDRTD